MGVIGTVIHTPMGNFKVRASRGSDGAKGMSVPVAWRKYKDILIPHKSLDCIYTNPKVFKKNDEMLREIYPVISKLMGANSVKNGKIVPLGDLQKEKGVFYVEGVFNGETTRFYLFTEEQAKNMKDADGKPINLNAPAFAAIENGYNIVDGWKDSYAIHTPEKALPNLRIYPGTFKSGEFRYVEQEFFAPLGKIAELSNAGIKRKLNYYKPGPGVRGFLNGDEFIVGFGYVSGYSQPSLFGVLTEDAIKR